MATPLRPVIQEVIDEVSDKKRMSAGITACRERSGDFASELEMQLAGIAMVPEARAMMSERLTSYWAETAARAVSSATIANADFRPREVIIGAGFHAAVYAANRVRMGFPRPIVLEQGSAEQVGGAFAVSLNPVFRLNSRNRPGPVGQPDQDKALNYLPGGLIQPAMLTSEEYPTNADMAWLIRLTLAQYAEVYPGVTVARLAPRSTNNREITLTTSAGDIAVSRVIDARGPGPERGAGQADGKRVLTFGQMMARMGGTFPLRGVRQVAVIGGGNSGLCAAESLLGLAPGNSSAIGLDYVTRVDLYAADGTIDGRTCAQFRDMQRGRYIRLAQYLEGNVSNPSTRLRVIPRQGYATLLPDGALVNDRTYDLAVVCTGTTRPSLLSAALLYPSVRANAEGGTVLATQADPYQSYQIGPAAAIAFSAAEVSDGIADIPANKVAMFRLAPRTTALAVMLPGVPE